MKANKNLEKLQAEYNKIFDAMGYTEDVNVIVIAEYNRQLDVIVEKMNKIILK